jgi:acetolactate synthase-1/2/3 large subunit
MLIISGQVKFETTIASQPELNLRQIGDQELNIVAVVKPITKYAEMVTDKNDIRRHLEEAVYLAKHGRPGPVWLDIPLDIQGAMVDEDELVGFILPAEVVYDCKISEVIDALKNAKRPVIIAGNGVRLADALPSFSTLVKKVQIPVLTTISGVDLIASDHELFFGRPGILGERAANFIMQNSDLMIILGTRMNLRIISYNWEYFGREAKKIMVDIDPAELNKHTLNIDLKIVADLKYFIEKIILQLQKHPIDLILNDWLIYCQKTKERYPIVPEEYEEKKEYVNSHVFAKKLGSLLDSKSITVTGNGTAYTSTFQAFPIKDGQRLFSNVACASMGYDLPAAIGACFAHDCKDIVCLTGDGSIQMNLQELQTIIHYKLPIKIFMLNNNGYLSIRITQKNFFNGQFVGEGPESGVSMPDMIALAKVYGFKTHRISNHKEMDDTLSAVISEEGSVFCEVMLDPNEALSPKVSSYKKPDGSIVSKPLEDLYPFLERDEFLSNMLIKPIEDQQND